MKKIKFMIFAVSFMCILLCMNAAAEAINIPCEFDTYSENRSLGTKNYDVSEILLSGSVYDRCAEFTFDISPLSGKDYAGCVMTFWARNSFEDGKITFYDENHKLITTLTPGKTGLVKCEIDITSAIKEALADGRQKLTLYARYNKSVLAVFSSEYSKDKTMRPELVTTDMIPYIPGQRDVEYPIVTAEGIKKELSETLKGSHPYLFGGKDDFERVRENAFGKNEELTRMYAGIKAIADGYVKASPSPILVDISKEANFDRAQECYEVISKCAFVYLMENDEAYAERAWSEAKFFADMSSWGTCQFIDNNQIAFGVALCYDWMYDWLGEERRNLLVSSLYANHLDEIEDLFKNRDAAKYSTTYYRWYFSYNNHATLDNTLTFMQAMAIADTNPDKCAYIMSEALTNLQKAFDMCYPDSAWYEGISYWSNVGPDFGYMFMCMKNAFGHCFGYENIDFVMNQSDFPIYIGSSVSSFCFNDSVPSGRNRHPIKYVYGILTDNKALQKYSLENDNFTSPFTILFYDVDSDYSNEKITLGKDKFFRNMDMVTMRSSWEGGQEIFCGMVVQNAGVTHGHMNSGTICLDALGEQWITNPGRDNYSLDGYWETAQDGKRWQYYFGRAEANSCLVIAPSLDGGQTVMPDDTIDRYVSKEKGAYAVSDLTKTYAPHAESYERGIMLCDDRTKFVMQDELKLKSAQEVYSFVNIFKCDAQISEDGKSVILSKYNKKVKVDIICNQDFELSVMDATPLPSSPQNDKNMYIRNIRRLAVHFPKTEGFTLRFEFTPYLSEAELGSTSSEIVPLSLWDIPDGECEEILADSVTADGKALENFNPYNRCYSVDALPETLTCNANEKFEISYEESDDGTAKYIILTDKQTGRKKSYMLSTLSKQTGPNIIDVSGMRELGIKGISASADDGNVPSNTTDGDFGTRWSAEGRQHITYDLSNSVPLGCVAVAFYNGNARSAYFDIQISDDGETWETVSQNESCGTTNDYEYFSLSDKSARFVRIRGYGTSTGTWNSISEVKIYGR